MLILAGESMFGDKTTDALLLLKLQHQVGEDEGKGLRQPEEVPAECEGIMAREEH